MIEVDDARELRGAAGLGRDDDALAARDELAAERARCSGACGRSTPTASAARTRPCAPSQVQTHAPPPPPAPLAAPLRRPLSSPASDARFSPGQSITFDWSDVAGAATYTIQIDDSRVVLGAADRRPDRSPSRSYTTSTLPTTADVVARARQRRLRRAGAWSSARRFEVKN